MGQTGAKMAEAVVGPREVVRADDVMVTRRGVVWNVDGTMKSCLFCDYASKTQEVADGGLLYEDELVVAFAPSKTAAKQHLLVVPRQHITTVGDLFMSDAVVLERMRSVAAELLKKGGSSETTSSGTQFSFHIPPWNGIDHLHLHAFELPFNSLFDKFRFAEGKPWCASAAAVAQWITTNPDERDNEDYSGRNPTPVGIEGQSTPGDEQKDTAPRMSNNEEKEEQRVSPEDQV